MKKLNLSIWHLILLAAIAVVLTGGVVNAVMVPPKEITKEQFTFKDPFVFEYKKGWRVYADERGIFLSDRPIVAFIKSSLVDVPIEFRNEPNSVNRPKTLEQIVKEEKGQVISTDQLKMWLLPDYQQKTYHFS